MKEINLAGVPYELAEDAVKNYQALAEMPIPEVVQKCANVAEFANVAAEDAVKFLPEFLKNDYILADGSAAIGRGLIQTVQAVGELESQLLKVNARGIAALCFGALAVGGVYYLWKRVDSQQKNIDEMAKAMRAQVEAMQMMSKHIATLANK